MNPLKWIEFEKLAAYYVENGKIRSCLDEEFEAIDNAVIDGASDEINMDYEKMVGLRHDNEMGEM